MGNIGDSLGVVTFPGIVLQDKSEIQKAGAELRLVRTLSMQRKNLSQTSGTSPTVVVSLRPRGLRPPAAAAYLGCTPFAIEEAMRSGALRFRIVGGCRVVAIKDLDRYFESIQPQTGKREGRGRFKAYPIAARRAA